MRMLYVFLVALSSLGLAKEQNASGNDAKKKSYFTESWLAEFSEKQLMVQPKWSFASDQPKDGAYEVREYEPAWYVTSYTPCLNQTVANSYGYLQAYLYMNKYNEDYRKYDLTYPIINKAEYDLELIDEDGKREPTPCRERFSVSFYLPNSPVGDWDSPGAGFHDSILISKQSNTIRRFVHSYNDVFNASSIDNCNAEAGMFASRLVLDGKSINAASYYCSVYEAGSSGRIGFEVWFDEEKSE